MGNGASVAIDISVDSLKGKEKHGVVTAGTDLAGHINVVVKKKMDAIPVTVQVHGKEKTAIRRQKGAERSLWVTNTVLEPPFPNQQDHQADKVTPGEYALPFSISLPDSLPSSEAFPSEKKLGHGFQITYCIVARMGRLESRVPLRIVSAPLPKDPVPCMIRPTSHPINSMKFFQAGEVAVGAKVGNVNVGRGQEAELHLVCQNSSTTTIRSLDIKLVEYVEWRIDGQREAIRTNNRTLLSMKNVPMSCVNPDPRRAKLKRQPSKEKNTLDQDDGHVYNQLIHGKDPLFIPIPDTARDSYKGQLLHIWHLIELNIHTGSLSCNLNTQIPVRIGNSSESPSSGGSTPVSQSSTTTNLSDTSNSSSSTSPPSSPKSTTVPKVFASPSCPPPLAPQATMSDRVARSPATPVRMPEDETIIGTPIRSSLIAAAEHVVLLGGCSSTREPPHMTIASAPPDLSDVEVTTQALLEQMEVSVNDLELISYLVTEKEWKALFGRISPHEFGSIVQKVKIEQDQPRVADLLATYVLNQKCFTCEYAASAVRNTSEWHRGATAQALIPRCHDIVQHSELIHAELTEFERTQTSGDFEEAILSAMAIGRGTGRLVPI